MLTDANQPLRLESINHKLRGHSPKTSLLQMAKTHKFWQPHRQLLWGLPLRQALGLCPEFHQACSVRMRSNSSRPCTKTSWVRVWMQSLHHPSSYHKETKPPQLPQNQRKSQQTFTKYSWSIEPLSLVIRSNQSRGVWWHQSSNRLSHQPHTSPPSTTTQNSVKQSIRTRLMRDSPHSMETMMLTQWSTDWHPR